MTVCRKRKFKTEADARRALKAMRGKAIDQARLNVYQCSVHLGKWHVGNRPFSPDARAVLEGRRL